MGIWTQNICQRYDVRTPIDGIRGMVEISRHYAEKYCKITSLHTKRGVVYLYEKHLIFMCRML